MKPTFEQTVDVLVRAYMNDELAHRICSACAVGNIVAAALGTRPKVIGGPTVFDNNLFEDGTRTDWYDAMIGSHCRGIDQIHKTGYTVSEIKQIEHAFEHAPGEPEGDGMFPGKTTDPVWMFNGLMAVVDVLAEIHGVDLTAKESAKLQFVKKLIV
jgi:hypothetical protein